MPGKRWYVTLDYLAKTLFYFHLFSFWAYLKITTDISLIFPYAMFGTDDLGIKETMGWETGEKDFWPFG
jgi:hypothetical protein